MGASLQDEELAAEEDDYLARRIESMSGAGSPLDESTKARLELGLGASLSGVRIHTGGEADKLSREMQAAAFTTGQDIFFRSGLFNPHTSEGLRLLAHEATHTVQQSQGAVDGTPTAGGVSVSDPSDKFEQAAERAAESVVGGNSADHASSGSSSDSSGVAVQRNWWDDYVASMWGREPAQYGERPRGHAYAKTNDVNGVEAGFAAVAGSGDIGGVRVDPSMLYGQGRAGAWRDDNATRYGISGNAGVARMDINKGGLVSGDIGAFTAGAEASAGTNGATLGATANIVEGSITMGNFTNSSNNQSNMRLGLSAGVGAAGRLHWGDSDGDRHREYGFGFDAGPVSFDYKTEDPLRTGAAAVLGGIAGPGGIYAVDKGLEWLMGDTNMTDKAWEYGKAGYGAARDAYNWAGDNLSAGWDAAKRGVSSAYDTASNAVSSAYDTAADYGNRAYNTVSDGVSSMWNSAKSYGTDAANWVSNTASSAYDTASSAASSAWGATKRGAGAAYDAVSGAANSAYDTVSGAASSAYDTVSGAASSAYDTASSAVSSAWDWATDW
jgi:hypothetical protein